MEKGNDLSFLNYFIFPAKSGFHLCTVIYETIPLNCFLHDKIFLTVFPCTTKLPHGSHIRIRPDSCSKITFPQGGGAQINNCIYCLLSKHSKTACSGVEGRVPSSSLLTWPQLACSAETKNPLKTREDLLRSVLDRRTFGLLCSQVIVTSFSNLENMMEQLQIRVILVIENIKFWFDWHF